MEVGVIGSGYMYHVWGGWEVREIDETEIELRQFLSCPILTIV